MFLVLGRRTPKHKGTLCGPPAPLMDMSRELLVVGKPSLWSYASGYSPCACMVLHYLIIINKVHHLRSLLPFESGFFCFFKGGIFTFVGRLSRRLRIFCASDLLARPKSVKRAFNRSMSRPASAAARDDLMWTSTAYLRLASEVLKRSSRIRNCRFVSTFSGRSQLEPHAPVEDELRW